MLNLVDENLAVPVEFNPFKYLVEVSVDLSAAQSVSEIIAIVAKAARRLSGSDGATFVLREDDLCFYVDENAITPLWKGRKFPLRQCVSGWSILNGQTSIILDIYNDERVPVAAYETTFVKSLVIVPIGKLNPVGAIGNYWAKMGTISEESVSLLESLANLTAVALEKMLLLDKLKKANLALENTIQARDEFLSIASHELRTPLTSLQLQVHMLDKRLAPIPEALPESPKVKNSLEICRRQVTGLSNLVDNLMDVSTIQLHRVELKLVELDVSALVVKVAEQMQPSIQTSGCELDLNLPSGLIGQFDQVKMEQIVANLLGNALKFAPGAKIGISLSKEHGLVILTAEDTGPGIPTEHAKTIFNRFTRGANSINASGLGLGLYIVSSLVEAHGGRIGFENRQPTGARFTVELPCR
jgi:signal transduction histidine kinase